VVLLLPQQWQSPPEGVWRGSGQAHLLDLVHGCGRGWGGYSKKRCCEGASMLNAAGSCVGEVGGGGVGCRCCRELGAGGLIERARRTGMGRKGKGAPLSRQFAKASPPGGACTRVRLPATGPGPARASCGQLPSDTVAKGQSGQGKQTTSARTCTSPSLTAHRAHHHARTRLAPPVPYVTAAMATLAAHDQENAVRSLQVGPGGKPLNAAAKSFGSKTPANKAPKTPFKLPLNDENNFTRGGKQDAKGSLFMTTQKGGKLDASAFVTPAGMRCLLTTIAAQLTDSTTRSSQPCSSRRKDNQRQGQGLPDAWASWILRQNPESKPPSAPSQSEGPPA
jgi:hypothetical protein